MPDKPSSNFLRLFHMEPVIDTSLKIQRLTALRDFVKELEPSHTFALAAFLMSLKGKEEETTESGVLCKWPMGWDLSMPGQY